jgi:hypothetical protein
MKALKQLTGILGDCTKCNIMRPAELAVGMALNELEAELREAQIVTIQLKLLADMADETGRCPDGATSDCAKFKSCITCCHAWARKKAEKALAHTPDYGRRSIIWHGMSDIDFLRWQQQMLTSPKLALYSDEYSRLASIITRLREEEACRDQGQ